MFLNVAPRLGLERYGDHSVNVDRIEASACLEYTADTLSREDDQASGCLVGSYGECWDSEVGRSQVRLVFGG